MATPIIELISENIKTAINEITTANGYNQTLAGYRSKRIDFSDFRPENHKVLIVQADEDDADQVVQDGVAKEWAQPYMLLAIVVDSDAATTSIDTRINQVRADIQKKLMVDPTRGGYAIDTVLLPGEKIPENDLGYSGIVVNIVVNYRVKIEDPYTQI